MYSPAGGSPGMVVGSQVSKLCAAPATPHATCDLVGDAQRCLSQRCLSETFSRYLPTQGRSPTSPLRLRVHRGHRGSIGLMEGSITIH